MLQCTIAGGRTKGANEESFVSSTNMAAMTSNENYLLGSFNDAHNAEEIIT